MILVSVSVWAQAIASALFLIRYTMLIRWWKTVCGTMLAGMVACLCLITSTLAIINSNEGLSGTPVTVTVGRFGFAVVVLYGLVGLEVRSRRRRRNKKEIRKEEGIDA